MWVPVCNWLCNRYFYPVVETQGRREAFGLFTDLCICTLPTGIERGKRMTKDFSRNGDIRDRGDQRSKAALLGFSSEKPRGISSEF